MRSFIIELARSGGALALDYFRRASVSVDRKGRGDYVSHADRVVEDAIVSRIRAHYPNHLIIGEEGRDRPQGQWPSLEGPCWIIDPIDGTTNFLRGIAQFAVSIAFCDEQANPRMGVVYDPVADELFIAERGAGLWLGSQRQYSSGCQRLEEALVATALPFRQMEAFADAHAALGQLHPRIDDMRRSGSCALDLAHVAVGRLDAYYELGIWSWDTAAGELLVRCGGGMATDFRGESGNLLARRSCIAAATPELHAALTAACARLLPWADAPVYADNALARQQAAMRLPAP